MRYTGIQPQYFPRLHYFARIMATDLFVIRDDVQFVRRLKYPDGANRPSFQAHSPIKLANGIYNLVLPVSHEGLTPIKMSHINYQYNWVNAHVGTIKTAYSRSGDFAVIYPEIKSILDKKYEYLSQLNLATILWGVLRLLGEKEVTLDKLTLEYVNQKLAKDPRFRLKEIKLTTGLETFKKIKKMSATEKIIAICKEIGIKEDYCGGTAMLAYMDKSLFNKHGIKITVQDWKCQKYRQLFEDKVGFIDNLSIIDLLMNVPYAQAVKIING